MKPPKPDKYGDAFVTIYQCTGQERRGDVVGLGDVRAGQVQLHFRDKPPLGRRLRVRVEITMEQLIALPPHYYSTPKAALESRPQG